MDDTIPALIHVPPLKTAKPEVQHESKVEFSELPLPRRLPRFDPRDFVKFYKMMVDSEMTYDDMVEYIVTYLNQYFVAIQTERYEVAEIVSESNGEWCIDIEYILRSDTETRKRMLKCKIADDNGKAVNIFDIWTSSLHQELRHGIEFRPDQREKTDKNMMNSFFGFKGDIDSQHKFIEDADTSKISKILDLAMKLCGNNKEHYEYLLDWLAYPLQEGKKTGVAILVKGLPGCGKGIFFNELMP